MKTLHYISILIVLTLASCAMDPPIPIAKAVCGTPGFPQGNWKITFVVTGTTTPDSVTFDMNGGNINVGSYYRRFFLHPSMPLKDSTLFCGDIHSDANIQVFDRDTTHIYTALLYMNDSLIYTHSATAGRFGRGLP